MGKYKKKLKLTWRQRPDPIGEIQLNEDVFKLFELGQCYGIAPSIRITRDKDGELKEIELMHLALIPRNSHMRNKLDLIEVKEVAL